MMSMAEKLEQPLSLKLILVLLISMSFLMIRFFIPTIVGNENVYLLAAKKIVDTSFLQNDWTWGSVASVARTSFAYDLLIAPLWIFFGDAIHIALIGRLIVWSLLLYSVVRFCQELCVEWWLIPPVFWFLIFVRQSFAAGSWMFGGVEQKCFSYAFLILALTAILQKKQVRGAVFCGLSIIFHVIVGGWGFMALLTAQVVLYKDYNFRRIVRFALLTICLSSPIIIIALSYLGGLGGGETSQGFLAHDLIVKFRNPHHLDPNYFLGWKVGLRIFLAYLFTVFALYKAINRKKALFLISFLSFCIVVFVLGLFARWFGFTWFLVFYPFRLAGIFLCLLFYISCAAYFSYYLIGRSVDSQRLTKGLFPHVIFLALCVSLAIVMPSSKSFLGLGSFQSSLARFVQVWSSHIQGKQRPIERVGEWIKKNTDKESIFIAPPCVYDFWIWSERAEVVCFKSAPHNHRIIEWYERLIDLNGGKEFHSVGFASCAELIKNYRGLKKEQLMDLRGKYDATFFLVDEQRMDLEKINIYGDDHYYIYDLRGL
jgi:hypothetical protein